MKLKKGRKHKKSQECGSLIRGLFGPTGKALLISASYQIFAVGMGYAGTQNPSTELIQDKSLLDQSMAGLSVPYDNPNPAPRLYAQVPDVGETKCVMHDAPSGGGGGGYGGGGGGGFSLVPDTPKGVANQNGFQVGNQPTQGNNAGQWQMMQRYFADIQENPPTNRAANEAYTNQQSVLEGMKKNSPETKTTGVGEDLKGSSGAVFDSSAPGKDSGIATSLPGSDDPKFQKYLKQNGDYQRLHTALKKEEKKEAVLDKKLQRAKEKYPNASPYVKKILAKEITKWGDQLGTETGKVNMLKSQEKEEVKKLHDTYSVTIGK